VLLGYSRSTVIRIFERDPGVLIRRHPENIHKRGRRVIHIPRAVYLRVRAKLARGQRTLTTRSRPECT